MIQVHSMSIILLIAKRDIYFHICLMKEVLLLITTIMYKNIIIPYFNK